MHIEFGSDIDTRANREIMRETGENRLWDGACLFRSGRDALRMLAKKLSPVHTRVFVPALSCMSMIYPFEQNGIKAVYYPLTRNFTADYGFLDGCLTDGDIVLYMDYFGIATERSHEDRKNYFTDKKRQLRNLVTIDDRTHSLRQAMDACFSADYMLFSVRKWASLPDGGALLGKKPLVPVFDAYDGAYRDTKKRAMDLKSDYLRSGKERTKREFIRLFQEAEEGLGTDNRVIGMSEESVRLLKEIDWGKVETRRKSNAEFLFEMLREYALLPEVKEGPLFFPVTVRNQKTAQQYLAQNGIYCPVIWPQKESARDMCAFCGNIAAHMLAVPCDQRYCAQEMEYIGDQALIAARL